MIASNMSLATYWAFYIAQVGLAKGSGLAIELRWLFEYIRFGLLYDQLGGPNIAAMELIARRILQIQRAVRRNPKHPTFDGDDLYMASAMDETGAIVAARFDALVAEQQKYGLLVPAVQGQLEHPLGQLQEGGPAVQSFQLRLAKIYS